MTRPQLFIMLKEPNAGRVKTRLGADIGMTASAWWFRHQAARRIRMLSDPRWQVVLAVSPDVHGLTSRVWPTHLPKWPQGKGDLGNRMAAIFNHAPKGPVVIIGADIPEITSDLIAQAFKSLRNNDACIGPAPDGGYWLIGFKRGVKPVPKNLFDNVRWSSPDTMADTLATMGTDKIAILPSLRDVDTAADLKQLA